MTPAQAAASVLATTRTRRTGAWLVRLAERLGARVVVVSTLAGPGYYVTATRTIVVRPHGHDVDFTIAHELGHHVHRAVLGLAPAGLDEERFADDFARALLGRDSLDTKEAA